MPDKKLTDSEIVKVKELIKKLEEAYDNYYNSSKGMPYDMDTTLLDSVICFEHCLNEINRLQAENEQLTKDKENLAYSFANAVGQKMTAKTEAAKEFAVKIEKAFSKTENQIPNSEVVKQTVQICRNAIRIALKEFAKEGK